MQKTYLYLMVCVIGAMSLASCSEDSISPDAGGDGDGDSTTEVPLAQVAKPKPNPWLAQEEYSITHFNSAQTDAFSSAVKEGLLAHFTQIYHLYNLLIYNILRRNLQLFITEFCIFSPCIIFISNKNSDKSIEILHISPKYITSVDNLMIHIFSSTFNFLYSFTPSDRLESKS